MTLTLLQSLFSGVFGGGVYVSAYNYDHTGDDSIFRKVDRHYRNVDYNFNNSIVAHDIMLIRLAEPVENVPFVPLNTDSQVPANYQDLITLGFGFTRRSEEIPTRLMEVQLNYIPPETCSKYLDLFDNVRSGPGLLWYVVCCCFSQVILSCVDSFLLLCQ